MCWHIYIKNLNNDKLNCSHLTVSSQRIVFKCEKLIMCHSKRWNERQTIIALWSMFEVNSCTFAYYRSKNRKWTEKATEWYFRFSLDFQRKRNGDAREFVIFIVASLPNSIIQHHEHHAIGELVGKKSLINYFIFLWFKLNSAMNEISCRWMWRWKIIN